MRRVLPVLALGLTMCKAPAPSVVAKTASVVDSAPESTGDPLPSQPLALAPVDATGAVSAGAVTLARLGSRTLAFVADADERAVVTFDVDTATALASTPLGARPSAVLVTPGGRVVALGADDARVHVLAVVDAGRPLVQERVVDVPDEPVSAALTPAGDTLLVASRWGHALSVVAVAPLAGDSPVRSVDLPRDPGAVVASADGRSAVVVHAVGSRASLVDLAALTVRDVALDVTVQRVVPAFISMKPAPPLDISDGIPGLKQRNVPGRTVGLHADQTFAVARLESGHVVGPDVLVDTGPRSVSSGYGSSNDGPPMAPSITDVDPASGKVGATGSGVMGSRCLLPRAVALDAAANRLLVACAGTDDVMLLRLQSPVWATATLHVAQGPVGLAFDPGAQRAIVWSAFERVVSVVAVDPKLALTAHVPLARSTIASDEELRGRALFHATFDRRVSADGRACASCHPDGRDDALTWSSPNGVMQTPMLLQRLEGTAPYGWQGGAADLVHHVKQTTSRLGGTGLAASDVADLEAYLAAQRPPTPERQQRQPSVDVVSRGADIFRSAEAECSSCHRGEVTADGDLHDVDPGSDGKHRGHGFDTPSLRFIARSAPYFHDGRYATLGDLLTRTDGAMGHTAQLGPADRAALEAYLETL